MAHSRSRFATLVRSPVESSAAITDKRRIENEATIHVNDETVHSFIEFSGLKQSDLIRLQRTRKELLAGVETVTKQICAVIMESADGRRMDPKNKTRLHRTVRNLLESVLESELNDEWVSASKAAGSSLRDMGIDGCGLYALAARALTVFSPFIAGIHRRAEREAVRNALAVRLALEMSVVALGARPQGVSELQTIKQRDADLAFLNGLIREAASIGDLTSRSDLTRFPEFLRDTVAAINELLDSILLPLREAIEVLEKVHDRDLTPRLIKEYAGDYKLIPRALNPALDQLMEALRTVADAAQRVEEGAAKVSETSQSIAAGATEQASTLEQIRAAVEELTERTRSNAKKANETSRLAQEAEDHAEKGNKQVQAMVRAMEGVSRSADEISQIILVIEDIAFQTKNLALNAGIEASRAGVQGTRFAVVAREVRDLAERSAHAASETAQLIEKTLSRVHEGVAVVGQTESSLESITQAVREATAQVLGIAEVTGDQARGIEQVNIALEQVEIVTQNTAQSSEAGAAVAGELSREAVRLREEVNQFKIEVVVRVKRTSMDDDAFGRLSSHYHTSGVDRHESEENEGGFEAF
ncbi:MAG: methyl-accepting chemotaxis protein [bacterium]